MEHRTLGGTGIQVSAVALGTMMFGRWGNPDAAECTRIVDLALEGGINLIDTADLYDFGRSEEILGEALRGRRDDIVLATKFGNPMDDDPNHRGASRRWIRQSVENSLRRLQTDRIDLYQLHRPDPDTPLDETLDALDDLVRAGKVLAIGTSCFPAEMLVEAQWIADRRSLVAPRSEQPPYSILARGIERAVLPACRRHEVGVLVWAPLNGGWLTGKYRRGEAPPASSRAEREPDHFDHRGDWNAIKLDAVEKLEGIAGEAGITLTALALGFVLAHPAVSSALLGPRTPEQLADLLAIAGTRLDAETLAAIDALVPPGTDVNPADAGYSPPSLDRANW